MKFRIFNPLARRVSIRYWHAEAIVKKRNRHLMDTRFVYFDGPTAHMAAEGLRKIIRNENYRVQHTRPVIEQKTVYLIPIWTLAFWFRSLRESYMRKKGYYLTTIDGEYYS